MAGLQDALLMNTSGGHLKQYWGPQQSGGVLDALMPVVSLIFLSQCYILLGLPLVLNFMDLQYGFDAVDSNDVRRGLMQGGVVGTAWLLIADCLRMDHTRVAFGCFVSLFYTLAGGIGQGKQLSVFSFNSAARLFYDELSSSAQGIKLPADADAGLDETLISALQHVDDTAAPSETGNYVVQVWRACENYSENHGPLFNVGSSKSAMRVGDAFIDLDTRPPSYRDLLLPQILLYKYMGVDLNYLFSMDNQLDRCLRIWPFQTHAARAATLSLPWVAIAAAVPCYLESNALHGIAFCIQCPGFEKKINSVQAYWAKGVLGFEGLQQGIWPFLVAECGWPLRLATRVMGLALMLVAQIETLPLCIPVRRLWLLAKKHNIRKEGRKEGRTEERATVSRAPGHYSRHAKRGFVGLHNACKLPNACKLQAAHAEPPHPLASPPA